jgi:hypothetical protein
MRELDAVASISRSDESQEKARHIKEEVDELVREKESCCLLSSPTSSKTHSSSRDALQ